MKSHSLWRLSKNLNVQRLLNMSIIESSYKMCFHAYVIIYKYFPYLLVANTIRNCVCFCFLVFCLDRS